MDAIFATQETLLHHLKEGGQPYLCLFDIEKAFDSIEIPILLQHLFELGVNGKLWRLIKKWYTNSSCCVRIGSQLSEPFSVHRVVKQGSILSPTLFLTVMDRLLKEMRAECHGLSISQTYIGAAIHADDLRTIAESKEVVSKQACVVSTFAKAVNLKLNSSKVEVLWISWKHHDPEIIQLGDLQLSTTSAVKCLGVWWQYNMSASRAVPENISKARKAFFALGGTGAFHGSLNPLSGRSIYESCILPILLYGCKTWLLHITSIKALEDFQCKIGKRILCLPKFHSKNVVRIALH